MKEGELTDDCADILPSTTGVCRQSGCFAFGRGDSSEVLAEGSSSRDLFLNSLRRFTAFCPSDDISEREERKNAIENKKEERKKERGKNAKMWTDDSTEEKMVDGACSGCVTRERTPTMIMVRHGIWPKRNPWSCQGGKADRKSDQQVP